MKRVFTKSLWALGLSLVLASGAQAAPAAERPLVVGYYPYWATDLAPAKIRFDRFTHIIHAFVGVGANGAPEVRAAVPSKALTSAARAAGTKVILGLGGGSNGANFAKMVRDPELSKNFIAQVVQMTVDYGYDGLDIDWEYPAEGDRQLLTDFVNSMHGALKAIDPNLMLVMAMPKSNYYGQWYDVEAIKDKLDWIQIMTYDMHGPWSAHAGYNSALYASPTDTDGRALNFEAAATYWLNRGFSAKQVLMGIACYGRGFTVATWGDKPGGKNAHEDIAYKRVLGLLGTGWVRQWDAKSAVPYLQKNGGGELLSYDDEVSAELKGAWSRARGVGGIFFWAIDQDYIDGDNKIVAAADRKSVV